VTRHKVEGIDVRRSVNLIKNQPEGAEGAEHIASPTLTSPVAVDPS